MTTKELPVEYRQVYEKLKGYINTSSQGSLRERPIEDIEAFAHHYLVALGVLSRMRTVPDFQVYVPVFQKALLEANLLLYPEEEMTLDKMWEYICLKLPAQLWENRWYYAAATGISAVCAVIAFLIILQNFEMAPVFIPAGLRSNYEMEAYLFSTGAQQEMLTAGRDAGMHSKTLFAVSLMIHNTKVAILCFVSGFLFGLPTLFMLIQNGLMLGAFPALFYKGDIYGLGAWLLPHGVPELSAIFLAGGGGLRLGLTMLRPGTGKLWIRFRKVLEQSVGTILVCAVLLCWAGLVESFVRQSDLSNAVRYMIAGASVIPLVLMFVYASIAHNYLQQREAVRLERSREEGHSVRAA